MKLLVVEDEMKVVTFLKKGLEENKYDVDVAYDGLAGRQLALEKNYDLVVLDLNLPKMSGYEVCSSLRKSGMRVPVLMLTAFGTTEDKVMGFNSGADDYLVKPFEFSELLARIKAIINRASNPYTTDPILRVCDLEMNLSNKTVKRGEQKIDLTAKEFALLEYFIHNKGKVLSREDISLKIWDTSFDSNSNVIDVYINFLRKKIDKNFQPKLIHTRIGMGYILDAAE